MDISKITDYLYIAASLQSEHVDELGARNINLIISMIGGRCPPEIYSQPPYRLLWLQTFDSALLPIPISKLMRGVQMALPAIQDGGNVLVYCAQGRHRSVAMAAAILIAVGYTVPEATELLSTRREVADPKTWHIYQRIEAFEKHWRNKIGTPNRIVNNIGEAYSELATNLISNIIFQHIRLSRGFLRDTFMKS